MINRQRYVDLLNLYREANLIKVLTGIRRSGKSTIFRLYVDQLIEEGVDEDRIQYYNFESPLVERELGSDWSSIFFSIYKRLKTGEKNYIFLDEVQQIPEFEKLLDGLFVEHNVDLYITGSNAYLLSSELATLLTGRAVEIHVLPYSFQEFKIGAKSSEENQQLFIQHYLQESNLPESVNLIPQGRDIVLNYVQSVYQSILEKDIYPRIKNVNRRVFENVFKFVLANIGSEISPHSISKGLKQDGVNISSITISDYLQKLCDSYLLYKVNRFDIRGKKQLATLEKYYVPDLAIRNILVGRKDFEDRGHLIENLVYFELLRRGGQVWVGKMNRAEVDFVVKKQNGLIEYYQVAFSISDNETFEREIKPLKSIRDSYKKQIITADIFEGNQEGIEIKNIVNWCLEE